MIKESMKYLHLLLSFSLVMLISFSSLVVPFTYAESVGCAITKVGNPPGSPPPLPADCGGGSLPKNTPCFPIGAENGDGVPGKYCQLPPANPASTRTAFYSDGQFTNLYEKREQSNKWQDWGSEEMIKVIYQVAKVWRTGSPANSHRPAIPAHPDGHLIIMDITSDYHSEHHWGVAADIFATTDGHHCAASSANPGLSNWRCPYGPLDVQGSIDLGKIIVDTGYLNVIWHSNPTVIAAVTKYSHDYNPNRYPAVATSNYTGIRDVTEPHWDHFHLLIDRSSQKTNQYYTNFQRSKLKDC